MLSMCYIKNTYFYINYSLCMCLASVYVWYVVPSAYEVCNFVPVHTHAH